MLPEAGTQTTVGFTSQTSVAVTAKMTSAPGGPEPTTVISLGQTISGGVVSCSLIVWLQLAALRQESMACHVLVAEKSLPASWLVTVPIIVTGTFAVHASLALGLSKSHSTPHSTTRSGAQTMTGANVSRTRMIWSQKEELPQASVAL